MEEETKKASESRNCAAKKVKTATKVKDIACSIGNNGIVVANGKHIFAVIMFKKREKFTFQSRLFRLFRKKNNSLQNRRF